MSATIFSVALLALVSVFQMYRVKSEMQALLGAQQTTLVARVADDIDERLLTAQKALVAVAAIMPPAIVHDPAAARANLENRVAFRSLFDEVFLLSGDGTTLVDFPDAGRRGNSASEREFFQQTVKTRASYISRPFESKKSRQPYVTITAPILDARGEVAGILLGSLNLLKPNFLGRLSDAKVGKTGYFLLVTRDRTVVVAPEKERIMRQGPAPGVSPTFDHLVVGREGWEEGTNIHGVRALYSYSPLEAVPWVLATALPVSEAYAPIVTAQREIAGFAIVLALLIAPVVWFGTRRLLAPLLELRGDIHQLRSELDTPPDMAATKGDEILALVTDFRSLVRERGDFDSELMASEEQLNAILDHVPAPIAYIDANRRFRFANRAFSEWYGNSAIRHYGRLLDEVLGADEYARIGEHIKRALAGEVVRFQYNLSHAGVERHVDVRYVPDRAHSGGVAGLYVLMTDISEVDLISFEDVG